MIAIESRLKITAAFLALLLVAAALFPLTADAMGTSIIEYAVPTAGSQPFGITSGPDGALWFAESSGNKIGRITTGGVITEYAVPTAGSRPDGITSGPDGALWFTEWDGNKIGRITTGGLITEYAITTAGSRPDGITSGPDGALWFAESSGNKIGRITIGGVITEYAVPTAASVPRGITSGPDGALWFTEYNVNKIGRITTGGVITEYAVPTAGSQPAEITPGSDGALWFAEYGGNKIGRAVIQYTVNASVSGGHGTASPSAQTVDHGGSATINIAPDTGYTIASITDNGLPQAIANPYVINNMASDHNVVVTFGQSNSTWYLAEGSTAWGYSTYITIENPNTSAVNAQITYMTGKGSQSGGTVYLPAKSQATVNPASKITNQDFSTKVVCREGKAIAVDRTMSWTGSGAPSPEAHSSVGVTFPAKTWYLAEGSSAWGFECWTLVQNPNNKNTNVRLTYMIEGAAPRTVSHPLKANSRDSFSMEKDLKGKYDASIKVTSDIPVIPERSMYRNNKREGHDSIGTTTPAKDYFLAEGSTAWGFTTYVLIQNPNSKASDITLTYMKSPSGTVTQTIKGMPANSRKTVNVGKDVPGMENTDFSTKVHADKPIIAERAMYWGAGTPLGEASHDSIGMESPHKTFYLPDGQTSEGRETYTLVQNPNSSDVKVEISYLTPTGKGNFTKTETIPRDSRKSFNMLEHSKINGRAAIMVTCKTTGKKIMVERSMYWNNKGAGTDTIGGFSD